MIGSSKSMVILGIIIGLLLLVIGAGTGSSNVTLAGDFIFAMTFISGGLSMGEENAGLRITLLAVGGLFVISAFATSFDLSSLLSRF